MSPGQPLCYWLYTPTLAYVLTPLRARERAHEASVGLPLMVVVARVLAFCLGSTIVLGTVASALKTVVMPRAEPAMLARWVFVSLRRPFDWRVRHAAEWKDADRTMARFAPVALILLPGVWVAVVLVGFVPIYWALGVHVPRDAFMISGSSLLTLGFAFDHDGPSVAASFAEATLGLGLIA